MVTGSWWDFYFRLGSLTLDGRVWDDSLGLVIDLQLGGNALCHLPLSKPALHPSLTPPPRLPFQVTQSPRCTQGVVITGAAEIGQDKGALPAQDVFPPFFSSVFFFPGPTTSLLHSSPSLPLAFFSPHVIQFRIILLLVAHFSLMLRSRWLASLAAHQELCQSRSFFSAEKKTTTSCS